MTSDGLCPVCHQSVAATLRDNIGYHRDSIGRQVCPGSGHPWRITITSEPEFTGVTA